MRYAVGDVHGCACTLLALLNKLNLKEDDMVYFLGDYIDRGLDSKGVLDIVMNLPQAVCLMGNHEEFMLEARTGRLGVAQQWFANGGEATLRSFDNKVIPEKYYIFIEAMPRVIKLDDFYLAHAGIDDRLGLNTPSDVLLWDRYCTINPIFTGGRKLICGHTPQDLEKIERVIANEEDKIIIDNGCVYTQTGYGNLLALNIDTMELIIQPNIDKLERD